MERKKADVCQKFGLVNYTIQTMWKKRSNQIISAFERNGSIIERFRKPEPSDVNEALFKWLQQDRIDTVSSEQSCSDDKFHSS
jgi:hypothetical protein